MNELVVKRHGQSYIVTHPDIGGLVVDPDEKELARCFLFELCKITVENQPEQPQ